MRIVFFVSLLLAAYTAPAQFAPQAGLTGSTAISATSPEIKAWATSCNVQRGYIDIATPASGVTTTGDAAHATGPSNGTIVCLGDSGVATLTFAAALYDGAGADFAVFENGFKDPTNPAMAFLELAFLEVSSDGINYTRFPATSNTPSNVQIPGSGVYMDASLVNNLAGKYVSGFGTPFDLAELAGTPGLDVNNITHVRLVDVVGSVGAHACADNEAKIINDPYPTNFPTGGFDLDAVAAMHIHSTGFAGVSPDGISIFPNPAHDVLHIRFSHPATAQATITSATGQLVTQQQLASSLNTIAISDLPTGIYHLAISDETGLTIWAGRISKY